MSATLRENDRLTVREGGLQDREEIDEKLDRLMEQLLKISEGVAELKRDARALVWLCSAIQSGALVLISLYA